MAKKIRCFDSKKLAEVRLKMKMSLRDVEAKSGIPRRMISSYESGKTSDPGFHSISVLAELFGVPMEYFKSNKFFLSNTSSLQEIQKLFKDFRELEIRQAEEDSKNGRQVDPDFSFDCFMNTYIPLLETGELYKFYSVLKTSQSQS